MRRIILSPKKDSFGIHFKSFELKPRQSLFGRRLKPTGVRHTLVVIFGLHSVVELNCV